MRSGIRAVPGPNPVSKNYLKYRYVHIHMKLIKFLLEDETHEKISKIKCDHDLTWAELMVHGALELVSQVPLKFTKKELKEIAES